MNIQHLKAINVQRLEKQRVIEKKQTGVKKSESETKKKIKALITSTPFSIFMSALTIYTIFAIDIDKAFFMVHASFWFSVVHIFSIGIFICEAVFLVMTEDGYFLSFYFWIDIFSTLTMFLEVIWIEDLMNSVQNLQMAISIARISKASRFSKIGARSTKIMKLIRLIKLMKLMHKKEQKNNTKEKQDNLSVPSHSDKFSNSSSHDSMIKGDEKIDHLNQAESFFIERPNVDIERQIEVQRQWEEMKQRLESLEELEGEKDQNLEKTRVGKILKDEIQKNIVILVMGVIIFVPMLTADTWFSKTTEIGFVADLYLNDISQGLPDNDEKEAEISFLDIFVEISENSSYPITYMEEKLYDNTQISYPQSFGSTPINNLEDLRESDKTTIQDTNFIVIFSKISLNRVSSIINICRSLFITFLLVSASILFIRDIDNYALIPLEKMSNTVKKIQKNPFGVLMGKIQRLIQINNYKAASSENQTKDNELQNQIEKQELEVDILPTNIEDQLETNLLEKLLLKICFLLNIGAGQYAHKLMEMPTEEQSGSNTLQKVINMSGCLMYIKLAHIEQVVQVLKEESVCYINKVSSIIHRLVIRQGGIVLQQQNTEFLVVWQSNSVISSSSQFIDRFSEFIQGGITKRISNLAFLTFYEISSLLENSPELQKYESFLHRIPDYRRLKIHCSLSFGSVYIGSIDSNFKLNLKVIGHDLVIAKNLCQIAQKSGSALIANEFFVHLSEISRLFVRKVDTIKYIRYETEDTQDIDSIYAADLIIHKDKNKQTVFEEHKSDNTLKIELISAFEDRFRVNEQIKKQKLQQIADISSIDPNNSVPYSQWIQFWEQAMQAFENYQWRRATNNFEFAQQKREQIKDIYPSPPDHFTLKKLDQIRREKDSYKKTQHSLEELYLGF